MSNKQKIVSDLCMKYRGEPMTRTLADKLGNGLVIIALAAARQSFEPVYLWYPAIIIAKELMMVVGSLTIIKKTPPKGFKPLIIGKVSAIVQALAIMWLLLKWPKGIIVYSFSAFVAVLTVILYFHMWLSYFHGGKKNWKPLAET